MLATLACLKEGWCESLSCDSDGPGLEVEDNERALNGKELSLKAKSRSDAAH